MYYVGILMKLLSNLKFETRLHLFRENVKAIYGTGENDFVRVFFGRTDRVYALGEQEVTYAMLTLKFPKERFIF